MNRIHQTELAVLCAVLFTLSAMVTHPAGSMATHRQRVADTVQIDLEQFIDSELTSHSQLLAARLRSAQQIIESPENGVPPDATKRLRAVIDQTIEISTMTSNINESTIELDRTLDRNTKDDE